MPLRVWCATRRKGKRVRPRVRDDRMDAFEWVEVLLLVVVTAWMFSICL